MDENKNPSQCDVLEAELRTGRVLSYIDIIGMKILNYKGRIADLRHKHGYSFIDTKMKVPKNGTSKIAHYSIPVQGKLALKN